MKAEIVEVKNFDFEGEYIQRGANEIKVAPEWQPFWSTGNPPYEIPQGPCQTPEYKPITNEVDARRVLSGQTAQCWFIRWKTMDAGIYQLHDAEVGEFYQFSISGQAWCSNKEDPVISDGEMYMTLGIDPTGVTLPFDVRVLWAPWKPVGGKYAIFHSPIVQAQASQITLYIRAWNKWHLSHNDVYVDAASLIRLEEETGGGGGGTGEPVDYDRIQSIVEATVRAQLDLTRLST